MSGRGNQYGRWSRRVAGMRLLAFAWLVVGSSGLRAQPEDPGAFRVFYATHELIDGVYHVNAQISLRLSTEATRALRSVPLTIRIEIEFLNRLWFWLDNTEYQKVQEYQLEYDSLSNRYIVRNMQVANKETSFQRLADALAFVGNVDSLPVIDAVLLDEDLRYDVRLRAVLDKNNFPGPMRLFAIFRRDFSIHSEWFEWRLDAE
jgi:hypothetical protein